MRHIIDIPDTNLRVYASTFEGRTKIHLRHFYRNDEGEMMPTKKGITIDPDRYQELADALLEVGRAEMQGE